MHTNHSVYLKLQTQYGAKGQRHRRLKDARQSCSDLGFEGSLLVKLCLLFSLMKENLKQSWRERASVRFKPNNVIE